MVEHLTENQGVASSNLALGTSTDPITIDWRRRLTHMTATNVLRCMLGVLVAAAAIGCGGPTRAASTGSPTASSSAHTGPSSTYCPGLQPDHALVIAWLGQDTSKAVVRDVQDPLHGVTLCATPSGGPRIISGSLIGIWNPGDISTFDLLTGARTQVLTYVHNDGPVVTLDWSPDQSFVYGRLAKDGHSITFHLVLPGSDRVLTTVTGSALGVGTTRAEFSPSGDYVALGAPGGATAGDQASVQVRKLDGTLVFSSGGTGQLTWAGESPKLYFDSGTGVQTWDPVNGARVMPVTTWQEPRRSPGGRWLSYRTRDYPSNVRIIDTRGGADQLIGRATSGPEWVTASLIRFDDAVTCPSPGAAATQCVSQSVIYDLTDATKDASALGHVFATWPRSSPRWS